MDDDNIDIDIEIDSEPGKHWTGRSEGDHASLQAAIEDAWHKAKEDKAPAGEYDVAIRIVTENPIHAYVVVITPTG